MTAVTATTMRRSLSDGRSEPPCFEMLLRCSGIETTHAAACVSVSGDGDGAESGHGDDDAKELKRRKVRAPLLLDAAALQQH